MVSVRNMEISKEFSKWVYEDGLLAVEDPAHPCRPMVDWQANNGFDSFQLPEPYSGARSDLGLAFIGLNPSISQSRSIPKATPEWTFEKYDQFYRHRFESGPRDDNGHLLENVWLWNNIERFGNRYLSELVTGQFKLGFNATLIEVVRYKSTGGWIGKRKEKRKILEHQYGFTQTLLEESGCKIVVPMGREAIHQLNQILKIPRPMPTKVGDAMGMLYRAETKNGIELYVCPIQHMSYPAAREKTSAVATQILHAYEATRGDQQDYPKVA